MTISEIYQHLLGEEDIFETYAQLQTWFCNMVYYRPKLIKIYQCLQERGLDVGMSYDEFLSSTLAQSTIELSSITTEELRVPYDEKGRPIYEEAPISQVAWDELVRQAGDVDIAVVVANAMVEKCKKEFKEISNDFPSLQPIYRINEADYDPDLSTAAGPSEMIEILQEAARKKRAELDKISAIEKQNRVLIDNHMANRKAAERKMELWNAIAMASGRCSTKQEPSEPPKDTYHLKVDDSYTDGKSLDNSIEDINTPIHSTYQAREELTKEQEERLLVVGFQLAYEFFNQQIISFNIFAPQMISYVGDCIRPWVKGIYEGAKRMPRYRGVTFSSSDYVDNYNLSTIQINKGSEDYDSEITVSADVANDTDDCEESETCDTDNIDLQDPPSEDEEQKPSNSADKRFYCFRNTAYGTSMDVLVIGNFVPSKIGKIKST